MIKNSKKNNKGFTLIELLVVIGIISVLAAVAVPNFMGARERARDAQRKNDIRQIQNAFELYKQNQNPPRYLTDTQWATGLTCGSAWISLAGDTYMNKFPCDPSSGSKYSYTRDASDTLKYTLYACLENKSDPDGVTATAGECTSLIKYQVTEP